MHVLPAAPSKPKGPLKVSDVTAKNCKLSWKEPEDDGGAPITAYAVEKMDTSQPGTCSQIIEELEAGSRVPVTNLS